MTEESFVAEMRRLRVDQGIRQEDMAAAVGLKRQAIVEMEAGQRRVRLDEALAIADVLGVSLEEMLK